MTRVWKVFKILVSRSWIFSLQWRQNMFVQIKRLSWKKSNKKLSRLDQNNEINFYKTELKVIERHISNKEIFVLTSCVKLEGSVSKAANNKIKSFGKPWRISFPISQNNFETITWKWNLKLKMIWWFLTISI